MYIYEDALPELHQLATTHQLALVTSGNSSPARAQIDNVFRYTVVAEECGFAKPDKRIFEMLLTEAGVRANELIHVGDSLESDVAGALNVGATTVYLNRDHAFNTSSIASHYEISDLRELYPIIYA